MASGGGVVCVCGVWSVEYRVRRSIAPAAQNTLSTRLQAQETVTKCHECHAKPHDKTTAKPEENQRLKTRHVGASKRTFRARLPPDFTICSFKSTFSQEFF